MKKILLAVLVLVLFYSIVGAVELVREESAATTIFFPIVDADGDIVTSATGLDSEFSEWENTGSDNPSTFADCTNEATEIGATGWYYIHLVATEVSEAFTAVRIQTTSAGAKTQHILIRTVVGDPVNMATTTSGYEITTGSDGLPDVNVVEWEDTDIASPTQAGVPIVDVQYYEGATDVDGNIQSEATDALNAYDPPTRGEATTDKAAVITEVDANETKIDVIDGIVDNVLLYTDGDGSDGIDVIIDALVTGKDSVTNAIHANNKVNFMRWTAAQVGSLLNTTEDANKANYKATGFATSSEGDSIIAAIADANKPNFFNWSDAQRDSILNTVEDANKVNYMRWTAAQRDSILNTVEDANKVNFMRWTAAQMGSLLTTVKDANKANFKATGFAVKGDPMTLQSDSLKTLMTDVDGIKTITDKLLFTTPNDTLVIDLSHAWPLTGAASTTDTAKINTWFVNNYDPDDDDLISVEAGVGGADTSDIKSMIQRNWDVDDDASLMAEISGEGARTVTITLMDAADGTTPISGFKIDVYDEDSDEYQGSGWTDSNGEITFSLDDETYAVHVRKTPWDIWTPRSFVVDANADSTLLATAFDAGDPASADMCRIYINDIRDLGAVELEDYELRASINEKYYPVTVGDAFRAPRLAVAFSNSSGYVYLDVYRSTGLTAGDGTSTVLYDLELLDDDGNQVVRRRNVEIPDAANWEIDWTE